MANYAQEFPKMPSVKIDGKPCHLVWPAGHPLQGTVVVFQDAVEEARYRGEGVVVSPRLAGTSEHTAVVEAERQNHSHQHPPVRLP